MIEYRDSLEGIGTEHLAGFFVDSPNPPSPETHFCVLAGSHHMMLAVETDTAQVVGFITAITDGVLCSYIPLLEVLPAYSGKGIGSELVRRMLARLADLYMIDTTCDADLEPFYRRFGMQPATGMMLRNHDRQSGT